MDRIKKAEEILAKSVARPTFPKLKRITTRPDQEVHAVGTERQAKIAAGAAVASVNARAKELNAKKPAKGLKATATEVFSQVAGSNGKAGALGVTLSYGIPVAGGTKAELPKSVAAAHSSRMGDFVQEHEGMHHLINEVRRHYGEGNAINVMSGMIEHYHPHDLAAVSAVLHSHGYHPMHGEEILTHIRDIVSNPKARANMKRAVASASEAGATMDPRTPWYGAHTHDVGRMRRSYNEMVGYMHGIEEKHLDPAHFPKADPVAAKSKTPKACAACGGKLGRGKPKSVHPNMVGMDSKDPQAKVPLCRNCSSGLDDKRKGKLTTKNEGSSFDSFLKSEDILGDVLSRIQLKLQALRKAKK